MKKIFALILAILLVFTCLSGCASKADNAAPAETQPAAADAAADTAQEAEAPAETADEVWTIGLEYSASSCEFCQKFADVVKEYGEQQGFKVILTQGNRSVSNQITNVESMLAQDCKIIGGFWDDPDACLVAKDACAAQDVWCIGVLCSLTDRAEGYEKYRFVGSENFNGGYLYGQYAAEHLPENAKICELHGISSDAQDQGRFSGFWAAIEDAGRTDIEVLDIQYTNNNRDEGLKVTENWIQAFQEIDGIVCYSDELAVAGVEALRGAGLNGKVQVYGFDGSNEGAQMVLDGDMMCDVLQDYKTQAMAYIDLCVSIRDTGDSADMDVPFTLITPENAEQYLNY